jgi:hypothetical protein
MHGATIKETPCIKFYVYRSVHRESNYKKFQPDDTVQYFISCHDRK